MTKSEIIDLQTKLHNRGYGPVKIDGIYGPQTAAAYAAMLRMNPVGGLDQPLPVPVPAKPWWASRAQVGWLLAIALNILANRLGVELDADAWVPPVLEILSGVAAIIGLWGNTHRKAPIDSTLVLPGVRIGAGGLRESERVPTDATETRQPDNPFIDP